MQRMTYVGLIAVLLVFGIKTTFCRDMGSTSKFLESIQNQDTSTYLSIIDSVALDYFPSSSIHLFDSIIKMNHGENYSYQFYKFDSLKIEDINGYNLTSNNVIYQLEGKGAYSFIYLRQNSKTNKIINVNMDGKMSHIPDFVPYWVMFIIGLCVLGINLWAIYLVFKNKLHKANILYPIILNLFSFKYFAIGTFKIKFLTLQFFGFAFNYTNYLETGVSMSIPLGAFLVIRKVYKLKLNNRELKE